MEEDKIELRSDKVNNIIGQIPNIIIRIGISVLAMVICATIFVSTLIEHKTIVDAEIGISKSNNTLSFKVSNNNLVKPGQMVEIDFNQIFQINSPPVLIEIDTLRDGVIMSKNEAKRTAHINQAKLSLYLKNNEITIKDTLYSPCKILIKKESLFSWIKNKI